MSSKPESSMRLTVLEILFGAEYEKSNKEIAFKNVFTVSTLAYDILKQYLWKFKGKDGAPAAETGSETMLSGRALHELIQHRLPNFKHEQKIIYEFPYEWKNARDDNGKLYTTVKIIGHIDSINFKEGKILEFKTTQQKYKPKEGEESLPEIRDYHITQAGFYGFYNENMEYKVLKDGTFYAVPEDINMGIRSYESIVQRISDHITEHVLSAQDKSDGFNAIILRAKKCAWMVDKRLGEEQQITLPEGAS